MSVQCLCCTFPYVCRWTIFSIRLKVIALWFPVLVFMFEWKWKKPMFYEKSVWCKSVHVQVFDLFTCMVLCILYPMYNVCLPRFFQSMEWWKLVCLYMYYCVHFWKRKYMLEIKSFNVFVERIGFGGIVFSFILCAWFWLHEHEMIINQISVRLNIFHLVKFACETPTNWQTWRTWKKSN